METEIKIRILTTLLYLYVGAQTFLVLLSLPSVTLDGDALRELFKPLINILLIVGIAYFLPRKRSKPMYWISAGLLLIEFVRKVGGTTMLIWLKQSGQVSGLFPLTPAMIILAVAYACIFIVAVVIILQKDVRVYLTTTRASDHGRQNGANHIIR